MGPGTPPAAGPTSPTASPTSSSSSPSSALLPSTLRISSGILGTASHLYAGRPLSPSAADDSCTTERLTGLRRSDRPTALTSSVCAPALPGLAGATCDLEVRADDVAPPRADVPFLPRRSAVRLLQPPAASRSGPMPAALSLPRRAGVPTGKSPAALSRIRSVEDGEGAVRLGDPIPRRLRLGWGFLPGSPLSNTGKRLAGGPEGSASGLPVRR